ncbi:MAG TPA: phytoene desaturase family protein [Kouleothrix sp.]|uniref:phytoene desaturase family protein n=1 Tax=Kouleothrix sp. TaxID=2779161 RepID=UPI002BE9844A|nr:phytoene desaturase family protein [Kouleothrix sp.]HRC76406.1 phytoene desaturase family protein [Kouleothrix sp.]
MSVEQPTIIVGGGLGGLAAAIHLAAAGRRVLLLEKNERVGGKLNIVAEAGYTFDTGPSLLTMPWVLRNLFAAAGARLEDELSLAQIEPTCRYTWPDGTRFDAFQSLPLLIDQISRLEPRDVDRFLRFLAHTSRIYDAVSRPFLLQPFDGLRDLITPALLRDAWKIDSLRTVDRAVSSFFHSPYLRQVFNRYATYNGSSPYRAPATFNLIAYVELVEGGWYIRGGMYMLARALERLARRMGVEVRTSAPVEQIVVRDGVARGVLVAGTPIEAANVIVNADPRYAYEQLLPTETRTAARLARLEPSCSGFILLLGIAREYPQLAHHNIFFSSDYPREFAAIFDRGVVAPDPTVYVCASSITDPQHAPPGHTNMFVLVNAPALGSRVGWEREALGYRDLVVRKLERMGLADLDRHVAYERIITPADLQTRYNAVGGAIYGPASNHPFSAFLRPPLRARGLRRLFFVGGGTHPGGGIPLVLLSGRAVAQRVLAVR